MISLSVSYSQALLQVLQDGRPPLSAVETGPWFSEKEVVMARMELPDLAVHFHAGNLLTCTFRAATAVQSIKNYHQLTQSPWATPHIDLLPYGYLRLAKRYKIALPLPGERLMVKRLIGRVRGLQEALDVPVVLENMPMLPGGKYQFQSDPRIINTILEQTGCNMLLDTSHARVAAALRGWQIEDYINELPLEKVVHMHVSGPREKNGVLYDAHEPLGEEDYRVLEWILKRTRPQVLTLEYFKDPAELKTQLERLGQMIEGNG